MTSRSGRIILPPRLDKAHLKEGRVILQLTSLQDGSPSNQIRLRGQRGCSEY